MLFLVCSTRLSSWNELIAEPWAWGKKLDGFIALVVNLLQLVVSAPFKIISLDVQSHHQQLWFLFIDFGPKGPSALVKPRNNRLPSFLRMSDLFDCLLVSEPVYQSEDDVFQLCGGYMVNPFSQSYAIVDTSIQFTHPFILNHFYLFSHRLFLFIPFSFSPMIPNSDPRFCHLAHPLLSFILTLTFCHVILLSLFFVAGFFISRSWFILSGLLYFIFYFFV